MLKQDRGQKTATHTNTYMLLTINNKLVQRELRNSTKTHNTQTQQHIYNYIYIYIHTYTYVTYTHVYIYIYIGCYTHTCLHVYIYIYIYTTNSLCLEKVEGGKRELVAGVDDELVVYHIITIIISIVIT